MERYIKEYANARIKELKDNQLMQSQYKYLIFDKIMKALELRAMGLITINETIKAILEA